MLNRLIRAVSYNERGFTFSGFMILLSIIGIGAMVIQGAVSHYGKVLKKEAAVANAHAAYLAAQAFINATLAQGGTIDPKTDWKTVLAPYTIDAPSDGALRIFLNDTNTGIRSVEWQVGMASMRDLIVGVYPPGSFKRHMDEPNRDANGVQGRGQRGQGKGGGGRGAKGGGDAGRGKSQ